MKKTLLLLAAACLSGCAMHTGTPSGRASGGAAPLSFLKAEGRHIVNEEGQVVQLRGVNAGNWLLIEPWIINCPWQEGIESEKDIWDLMEKRFGREAKLELIRVYRDNFFTEADVQRIAAAGMNCIRLPIWWRATDDPEYGGDIAYVDQCVEWCEKYGLYVILDLHGAPGGQSDIAKIIGERSQGDLWRSETYKQQTIDWWERVARRYRDNPNVAGYDLINEAMSAQMPDLLALYDRIYKVIRGVDPKHMMWIEDGLIGFYRLPHAREFGWENVGYSFHYYPQDPEEAFRSNQQIIPLFHRAALYYEVPILMGEFNSMHFERGGAEMFHRYIDVFNFYGWSWTFWTYKKIENNHNDIWGLYGYYDDIPQINFNKDSFEHIKQSFERMNTDHSKVNPLMKAALLSPRPWPAPPGEAAKAPDAILMDLSDMFIIHGIDKEGLRAEWRWSYPNVGYWTKHDTLALVAPVPEDGVYELGIRMANNANNNKMSVWVDGVYVGDTSLPNTGDWNTYRDAPLLDMRLAKGTRIIELRQADGNDAFINAQYAWLRPTPNDPVTFSEKAIHLNPVNHRNYNFEDPIRVEWNQTPPNFGYWYSGLDVVWDLHLKKGGAYTLHVEYATPNDDTRLTVLLDGVEVLAEALPTTGDWHDVNTQKLGGIQLPAGEHTLGLRWDTENPDGAGNLRALRLER